MPKFEVALFRPGTQDYDLWLLKEAYAIGAIDLDRLELEIWLVLNHISESDSILRAFSIGYDRITIGREWK